MTEHDVVVVGAGLSGLAAARRLCEKGHSPIILESADGPGGRVRTDVVDGFRLDRGFQILLTAYPEAERVLDYEALDLRSFDPGALIRVGDRFHRLGDPLRQKSDAVSALRAPVGSIGDKLTTLRYRKEVTAGTLEELFASPEMTAIDRLRDVGFSDKMIERFFRPLFAGIALDDELQFTSHFLDFVFRMLAQGDAAVPAKGMQRIPEQLAAGLPAGTVHYGAKVETVETDHVILEGGDKMRAQAVVVATNLSDAAVLIDGIDDRGWVSVTTWWFASDETPVRRPVIVLDGADSGPINNLAVMSEVSDLYAPEGRSLIAVSTPSIDVEETAVRRQLGEWYGPWTDTWETLRVDRIPHAQPRQPMGLDPDQSVKLPNGLFVAGDYRQNASINGALVSGRRAGDAVAARLCRTC